MHSPNLVMRMIQPPSRLPTTATCLCMAMLLASGCITWDPRPLPRCDNLEELCVDLPEPDVRAQFAGRSAEAVPSILHVAKGQVVEWIDLDGFVSHRVAFAGFEHEPWKVMQEDQNLTWDLHHDRYRARPIVEGTFTYTACDRCKAGTLVVHPEGTVVHNPPAVAALERFPSRGQLEGVAFSPDGLLFSATITIGNTTPMALAVTNETWVVQREQIPLGNGTYPYRIDAVDELGFESQVEGIVVLPNRPPIVSIDSPVQFSQVRQPFSVSGSAFDPEGDQFWLTWFPVDVRDGRPIQVVDGKWEFVVAEGTYEPGPAQLWINSYDEGSRSGISTALAFEVLS